jgi:CheY-like chemotaxis protein
MATILLIDDEFAILEVLSGLLVDDGFRVLTANNGEEALARLAEEVPDVVVVDVMMPRLDGREVVRRMRADARTAHVPVIFMSAAGGFAAAAEQLGARAFLRKPFRIDALLAALKSALGA